MRQLGHCSGRGSRPRGPCPEQLTSVKGEINIYLSASEYDVLRFRLKAATVEANQRVRLNEGRDR
jgi:hypothetical protein